VHGAIKNKKTAFPGEFAVAVRFARKFVTYM